MTQTEVASPVGVTEKPTQLRQRAASTNDEQEMKQPVGEEKKKSVDGVEIIGNTGFKKSDTVDIKIMKYLAYNMNMKVSG